MIKEFQLNNEQGLAFGIVAVHALKQQPQFLLGVFGEGGTGKSRVVSTIRVWFERQPRQLVCTDGHRWSSGAEDRRVDTAQRCGSTWLREGDNNTYMYLKAQSGGVG